MGLKEQLAESEKLYRETGHYRGITRLSLKEAEPFRYEKVYSELRGAWFLLVRRHCTFLPPQS